MKHLFLPVTFFGIFIMFSSCTPTLELQAQNDGSYGISYNVKFGNNFLNTFASVTGWQRGMPLFDTDKMKSEFLSAGIANVSVTTANENQLEFQAPSVKSDNEILSKSKLITQEKNSAGKNTMRITLSPESMKSMYASLPEATQMYIDLFMAPAFTGDTMTKNEYVELIALVYGEPLANEIKDANLTLVLKAPNSTSNKNSASNVRTFYIPLVELLVISTETAYDISW